MGRALFELIYHQEHYGMIPNIHNAVQDAFSTIKNVIVLYFYRWPEGHFVKVRRYYKVTYYGQKDY